MRSSDVNLGGSWARDFSNSDSDAVGDDGKWDLGLGLVLDLGLRFADVRCMGWEFDDDDEFGTGIGKKGFEEK